MAYGEFYVERQGWARWPKVLIMCRKTGHGDEHRRYVPERTCSVESVCHWDGGVTPDHDEYAMACGGRFDWADTEPPEFCPCCGGAVHEPAQ